MEVCHGVFLVTVWQYFMLQMIFGVAAFCILLQQKSENRVVRYVTCERINISRLDKLYLELIVRLRM